MKLQAKQITQLVAMVISVSLMAIAGQQASLFNGIQGALDILGVPAFLLPLIITIEFTVAAMLAGYTMKNIHKNKASSTQVHGIPA